MASSRATGDGTGYGLTVKKNYESYAQKMKDLAKESPENREEKDRTNKAKEHKKRLFAYSFAIMDLETRLYIAIGSSMKSEREVVSTSLILHSIVSVCIFISIYYRGGRSRREGISNLLRLYWKTPVQTGMFFINQEVP